MHFSPSKKRSSVDHNESNEKYESKDEGGYDESIEVSKRGTRRSGNVFDVTLQTSNTVIQRKDNQKQRSKSHHPVDALLLAIMEEFHLDSLSISVSSVPASSSVSSSSSSSQTEKRFPVGTAVQFLHAHADNHDDSSNSKFEHNLLKILSSKNLLCENIQMRNIPLTNMNIGPVIQPDEHGSTILMLPNDAFALCHSSTLVEKIVSSSPCRHFLVFFSHVQTDLNNVDIVDRKAWVSVQVKRHGNGEKEIVIEKGLGFGRIINHPNVTLSRLLGWQVDAMQQQQPCRLARRSYIIARDGYGRECFKQDLMEHTMDMNRPIIGINDNFEEEGGENEKMPVPQKSCSFGIEKKIIRLNGMANAGTLQTRIFYNGRTCMEDAAALKVVDVYPKEAVSPMYHTLRAASVTGLGAGDHNFYFKFFSMDPKLNTPSVGGGRAITYYALDDLDFNITNGHLSLSKTRLPKDSSLYIQIDFKPKYLQFEAFSAYLNRGFDVPPSIVTFAFSSQDFTTSHVNAYSNALLIMPPVPDLSMPYNVISIVCTLFALIIGTTMNLTIRKSREEVVDQMKGGNGSKRSKGLKAKLREKIARVLNMLKSGRRGSNNVEHKQKSE